MTNQVISGLGTSEHRARLTARGRWPLAIMLAAGAAVGAATPTAAVAAETPGPACGSFGLDPVRSLPGHSQGMGDVSAVPGTSKAWAVGYFHDNESTADLTYTARWTGRDWKHVESPSPGKEDIDDHYLVGVSARTAKDVWAVGYQETSGGTRTLVEHWNGRRWRVVKSVDVSQYNSLHGVVALSRNDVWAVGRALNSDGGDQIRQETMIQHWNGKRWKVVPSPNVTGRDNRLGAVTAIPGTDQLMAVGHHQGQEAQPLVLMWDGTEWNIATPPESDVGGGYLSDVSAAPDGTVWAVGLSLDQHDGWDGLAAQWDGSTWTSRNPAPPPGEDSYNPAFNGVTVTSTNEVWAVGFYTNPFGAFLTLAERWDGTAWEVLPSANPGGTDHHAGNVFNGVAAISPTDVRAVGVYHLSGFNPDHALFESWCP